LKFTDGFPDDATVEKVYDNLDFQRGIQAFLNAMPGASVHGLREGIRGAGARDNQTILITETLMDSKPLFLTANTDSVYNMTWLRLSEQFASIAHLNRRPNIRRPVRRPSARTSPDDHPPAARAAH
jgi:hypothetical protein